MSGSLVPAFVSDVECGCRNFQGHERNEIPVFMLIELRGVQRVRKATIGWSIPADAKDAVNQFHLIGFLDQSPQRHIYRALLRWQAKAFHNNCYKLVININVGATHKQEI
jgi:hypothetical protein